jgi:hypothetical protein
MWYIGLTEVFGIGPSSVREDEIPQPLAQVPVSWGLTFPDRRAGFTRYITDLMEYAIDDRQVLLALFALVLYCRLFRSMLNNYEAIIG